MLEAARSERGAGAVVWALLLLGALATPASRWWLAPNRVGPAFWPRPDALEYVASAQAIAQEGRYFLQVGPARVRPRYSPGYPILLAAALRAGVAPGRLWMVTGLFDGLLVLVLGGAAAAAVARLGPRLGASRRAARVGAGLAVVLVSVTVALGQSLLTEGRTVLSDSAATALVLAALVVLGVALGRREQSRSEVPALGLAGVLAGLAWVIRPIEAVLAVPSALVLLAASRRDWRVPWGALGALAAGVALAVAPTVAVLLRSDLDPLRWSGYELWLPREREAGFFGLRYALDGYPGTWWPYRRPRSHFLFAVDSFIGVELQLRLLLGRLWPTLHVAAFGLFAVLARRLGRRIGSALPSAAAASIGMLLLGHVAFYSFFFWPAVRFYRAPALAMTAAAATLAGLGWARGGRARFAALLLVALTLVPAIADRPRVDPGNALAPRDLRRHVERAVDHWLRLPDAERAAGALQFDPVVAQALGLLPREVVERVGSSWGTLPRTAHVARLGGAGLKALLPEPGREVLERRRAPG